MWWYFIIKVLIKWMFNYVSQQLSTHHCSCYEYNMVLSCLKRRNCLKLRVLMFRYLTEYFVSLTKNNYIFLSNYEVFNVGFYLFSGKSLRGRNQLEKQEKNACDKLIYESSTLWWNVVVPIRIKKMWSYQGLNG